MRKFLGDEIAVIGAGIGGLTAAALLAKRGYPVTVYDLALVPGGCASTFKRQGFTFDVGATQVAGLEPAGIHHQIFSDLGVEIPAATICDPACAVFLPGESVPINVWRDPKRWQAEREKQFPGSENFWQFFDVLFAASWRFQSREPMLPPRNFWDVWQLLKALRPDTLITVPFTLWTVADALKFFGLADNLRLKTFLDLQLKLYSQVDSEETALLYAATALSVSQAPQGLYHLQGSMQVLSDRLVEALEKFGGKLLMRHRVEEIIIEQEKVTGIKVNNLKTGHIFNHPADIVVANVPVQNLVKLIPDQNQSYLANPLQNLAAIFGFGGMAAYRYRTEKLESPSGAFVVYLGVKETAIPAQCPPHLQFYYDYSGVIGENNSLFVSVSKPGDGRAPAGYRTITASSFTDIRKWQNRDNYQQLKESYTQEAIKRLSSYFQLTPETLVYQEAATPQTFEQYTGRESGIVGGVGQRISTFGPFGIATRTPIENLWLVGDSTHPGEGTAGVSYSALTAVKQIENR